MKIKVYKVLALTICVTMTLTACKTSSAEIGEESETVSVTEGSEIVSVTSINTEKSETTTISSASENFDDLNTPAGPLTYDLCKKTAAYCLKNELFPESLTVCDFNLDGKADIYVDGAWLGMAGYPVAAVVSDGFESFSYYNSFNYMPSLCVNNLTGKKEFIALSGYCLSSDSYNMKTISINGNKITIPYAASDVTGYIGGGFAMFGMDISTDIPIEECGYNFDDWNFSYEKYPSDFYSGMYHGDTYIMMQNYIKCEDTPMLTVNPPYDFFEYNPEKITQDEMARDYYRTFKEPVGIEPEKPDEFNTDKGSIICAKDVKPGDTAVYQDHYNANITLGFMMCQKTIDFLKENLSEGQGVIVSPCDINSDGIAEMLVGLYTGNEENATVYCIYEDGKAEKRTDFEPYWSGFSRSEESFYSAIDSGYYLNNDDYDAQKLYLFFTN